MSSGPSTFGIMMTSSLSPISVTAVTRSSRHHGESSEFTRVHSCVSLGFHALPTSTSPARAASLSVDGTPSSRLARRTSTVGAMSGTLATILAFEGGKKWMTRDGRRGISRTGSGAPTASGRKKSLARAHQAVPSTMRRAMTLRQRTSSAPSKIDSTRASTKYRLTSYSSA